MPVDNAGPSFVASCRCGWRSVHHLRRDAQQALGRHGETCFGARREGEAKGGKGAQKATGGDLTASGPSEAESLHHDHDDQREERKR